MLALLDAFVALLLSTSAADAGVGCRRCGDPIARGDEFGLSERVCRRCRR